MGRIRCVSHMHGAMHARTDAHTPTGRRYNSTGKSPVCARKVFEELLPNGNVKFCHLDSILHTVKIDK